MSKQHWKDLFFYIESQSSVDGKITTEELLKAVAPDLDNDKEISNKKLYVKKIEKKSKYTSNMITTYKYLTEGHEELTDDFTPYMSDGVHMTEKLLGEKSTGKWLSNFCEEMKDKEMDETEFLTAIKRIQSQTEEPPSCDGCEATCEGCN